MNIRAYEYSLLETMKKESINGHYTGTLADLAESTGWHWKTVLKHLHSLRGENRIEMIRHGRYGKPSIYKIREADFV